MDTIHIAAVSTNNYARHTAVMFNSILKNNKSNNTIHFYLVGNLSEENETKIKNSLENYPAKVYFFPVSETRFTGFKLFGYFKKEAYYRLLLPELLDESIERVIYLDSDIIVKHDINDLWKVNLNNYYLAAAQDLGQCASKARKKTLSIPLHAGYFNSGVLVMDLKKWREHNIANQVIEFAKQNPNKLRSIDQDALNALLYNKWLELDPTWNYNTATINRGKSITDPAIIHFTGKRKPWSHDHHPLRNEYLRYLESTRWDII
ncbi:glycosyltransferase family 8 protein [Neobacillus kokaensis]|uniref:General stress protein A n=1 Tax=Neobacillus kokaensis TaxID=2759023 RepID=A0ABQ3N6U0_9BACI|nr:glycosyltransferase family 8 protein [Neobacillus kokaensis]GHH99570.1 general stress protein A [Neobacillus kokaensis]